MKTHRLVLIAAAFLMTTLVVTSTGGASAQPRAPSSVEGVPAFGNVFVIVGENTEITQLNASNAPYQLGTILPQSAWLEDYFATTHNSEANYVAMTSGQFTKCEQQDKNPSFCNQDVPNLFHQLDSSGISWKEWMESMPSPCYLVNAGNDANLNGYAVRHNPAVDYADVEGAGGVWSATDLSSECVSSVVPAGTTGPDNMDYFDANLTADTVPRFNFIVPNVCEDSHDTCNATIPRVTQFDDFLAREVPLILHSEAFAHNGVLVITYDEGNTGANPLDPNGNGGHVVFAVLGHGVRRGLYGGIHDHYSLLRTLEDGFGLTGYVGGAADASAISSIWLP